MKIGTSGKSANALIVAMVVIATLGVCVAVTFDLSVGIGRQAQRSRAWSDGTATGLGAIDLAFASWRQICRGSYGTDLPAASLANIPVPTKANFPAVTTFTLANYKIDAVDPQLNVVPGPPVASVGQTASTRSVFYMASADVSIPVIPGLVTAKVRRVLEKQTLSPWNWAIFFNDPLEIHPGPLFSVTGWVHTNDNLYTGSKALTFNSKVTYTGSWKIGFKPGDTTHGVATSPYWPKDLPPARDQSHQPFGLDPSASFNPVSANPNINSGWRELIQRAVTPSTVPGSPFYDPLAPVPPAPAARYYDQAGYKIVFDNNGNSNANSPVRILNSAGLSLDGGNSTLSENAFWNYCQNNPVFQLKGAPIQDNREGGLVKLTTVDIGQLKQALSGSTFNGIIYLIDTGVGGGITPKRGVRLKNGSVLPNGGLTIVSENPIYVQGDFNTGTGTPPSNLSGASFDPTKPEVQTPVRYNRQPAAIIADAVYILSNAWNDANSAVSIGLPGSGSLRTASNTTVNAGIISGIVPTTAATNYSGGVENFPRFLEDWTGKSFTYYGSMIQLFSSGQATGTWGKPNVYEPPNRSWYFDTNFQVTPPKGSLVLTDYKKGRWYLE